MPLLKFEVQADYDKVIKLREEIERLDHLLKTLPLDTPKATIHNIEKELATARSEFNQLAHAAAIAGAEMEDGFKKRIYDASQSVNDLTEKIIAQKDKVRIMSAELRRVGDDLKGMAKDATGADWFKKQHLIEIYNELKQSLEIQKDTLFGLTQEQANARLSVKRLRDEYALIKQEAGDGTAVFDEMKQQLMGMGKDILGTLGVGVGIKEFVGQMVKVRGEFQQIETSLEVLTGSEEKAAKLMGEVKEFAKVSPLDLKSTAAATQMILGFNIEAEKVPRFLQAIGDVSMGNTQRFNSLTLAFSQMSATGKLMRQDLNQMINAGFNPLSVMAEKTGKSIATLKEEMSKGAITSEMVQQAFIDATSAGGKFYQMSERASKTIEGQISMMQDALDSSFNQLGEQSEGVILGSIEATTSLIENYETVGKVIAGLVAVYGTYKAAELIAIAVEWNHNKALWANIKTTKAATVVQAAFNKVMMANPYALAAAAIMAVAAATLVLSNRTSAAEKETERLNNRIKEQTDAIEKQKNKIDDLINSVKNEAKTDGERQEALNALKNAMPEVFNKYKTFIDLVNESSEALSKETNAIFARNNALNSKNNYTSDLSREKDLERLFVLGNNLGRNDKEQNEYNLLLSRYQAEIQPIAGAFKTVGDAALELLLNTRISLRMQASQLRDKANAAWDVALSKTTSAEQANAMTSQAQKHIDAAKAAGKEYVIIDGVPIPVSEFERRVKAGNARAKLITENANKDFLVEAKKSWDAAAKKVADIKKNRNDRSVYPDETMYKKALQDAQKEEEKAKAAYKSLGGDPTGKTARAAAKESNERLKAEQKIKELTTKNEKEVARWLEDAAMASREESINAMEDGSRKELEQMRLNHDKVILEIKREEEDLIAAHTDKARAIHEAEENANAAGKPSYKKKAFDPTSVSLSETEETVFANKIRQADAEYERERQRWLDSQEQKWSEYFERYGTYQEKRKAIIARYDKELAALENGTAEKALKLAEKEKELESLDEQYKGSTKAMADLFEDASEKSVGSIQKIIDKYELLVKYLSGTPDAGGKIISEDDIKAVGFTDEDIRKINEGEISIKDLTDALKALNGELEGKSPWMTFTKGLQKGIDKIKNANGDSNKLGEGLSQIGNSVETFIPAVNEFGNALGSIFGDERLAGDITAAAEALGGLGTATAGVGQIIGGDIVGGVMTAASGISRMIEPIERLFGADYSRYEQMVSEYERLTDVWDILIAKKKEYVSTSYGEEAIKAGEEAETLLNKKMESNRVLGRERLNSGASAGSHSIGVRQAKGMSSEGWEELRAASRNIGFNYDAVAGGRMTGLFDLTAEQLEQLQQQAPTFWAKLDGDTQQYLQNIIDCNEELEDMRESLRETLTGISFDSLRDSFIDSLMDMDKSAEDFADDFSNYLMRAVLNARINEELGDEIRAFYDKWAEYSKDGLDEREIEELRKEKERLDQRGIQIRDEAAQITGYDSTADGYKQEASKGAFETMSQDTGQEMNGRMTAIQDGVGRLEALAIERNEILRGGSAADIPEDLSVAELTNETLKIMMERQEEVYTVHTDTRRILAESYVELQQIRENTGEIIKPIKRMNEQLDSIDENIKKVI